MAVVELVEAVISSAMLSLQLGFLSVRVAGKILVEFSPGCVCLMAFRSPL
jgi:hypothetical protein